MSTVMPVHVSQALEGLWQFFESHLTAVLAEAPVDHAHPPCLALIKYADTYRPVTVPTTSSVQLVSTTFVGPAASNKVLAIIGKFEGLKLLRFTGKGSLSVAKTTGTPKTEVEQRRPHSPTGVRSQTFITKQQGENLNSSLGSTALTVYHHHSIYHADYLGALEKRQILQEGDLALILKDEQSTSSIHSVDEQFRALDHFSRSTPGRLQSITVDVAALKYVKPNGGNNYPKLGFGPSISLPLVLSPTSIHRTSARGNNYQRWFSEGSNLAIGSPINDGSCNEDVSDARQSSKSSEGSDEKHISLDLHEYILGNLKDDHEDELHALKQEHEEESSALSKRCQVLDRKAKILTEKLAKLSSEVAPSNQAASLKAAAHEADQARDAALEKVHGLETQIEQLSTDRAAQKAEKQQLVLDNAKLVNDVAGVAYSEIPYSRIHRHQATIFNLRRLYAGLEHDKEFVDDQLRHAEQKIARLEFQEADDQAGLHQRLEQALKENALHHARRDEEAEALSRAAAECSRAHLEQAAMRRLYWSLLIAARSQLEPSDLASRTADCLKAVIEDSDELLAQLSVTETELERARSDRTAAEEKAIRLESCAAPLAEGLEQAKKLAFQMEDANVYLELELVAARRRILRLEETLREAATRADGFDRALEAKQAETVRLLADQTPAPGAIKAYQEVLLERLQDERNGHEVTRERLAQANNFVDTLASDLAWAEEAYDRLERS